jgi:hypothetical protein
MIGFKLQLKRPEEHVESRPMGEVPFGVHPLLDLIKMMEIVLNQQVILHENQRRLFKSQKRQAWVLMICAFGWFLVAITSVLDRVWK